MWKQDRFLEYSNHIFNHSLRVVKKPRKQDTHSSLFHMTTKDKNEYNMWNDYLQNKEDIYV